MYNIRKFDLKFKTNWTSGLAYFFFWDQIIMVSKLYYLWLNCFKWFSNYIKFIFLSFLSSYFFLKNFWLQINWNHNLYVSAIVDWVYSVSPSTMHQVRPRLSYGLHFMPWLLPFPIYIISNSSFLSWIYSVSDNLSPFQILCYGSLT